MSGLVRTMKGKAHLKPEGAEIRKSKGKITNKN